MLILTFMLVWTIYRLKRSISRIIFYKIGCGKKEGSDKGQV
jgi:hypothetical protein